MDAAEFKALMERSGLSQGGLADKLGVTRATVNRWATGAVHVPDYVTPELMLDVTAEARVTPPPVTSKPNVTQTLDLSKLTPWTVPNLPPRDWFPLDPGKWQKVGHRVVSARIPAPIPYDAPAWAGWRGILTESGHVFDYETGTEMRPFGGAPRPDAPKPGARQQLDKKYRRAA